MPFTIVRQDITKMQVDAIVNAANRQLTQGSGVCGAIFDAAGPTKLAEACERLAPIDPGAAVHTPGFNLPAKYVIHTVGPMYDDGLHGEAELLRACYLNSLELAKKRKFKSIAFPLIASGLYGYPKDAALDIAAAAINEFLAANEMDVYLAVFSSESVLASEKLLGEVAKYVDTHYVESRPFMQDRPLISEYEFWAGLSQAQIDGLSPLLAKRREAVLLAGAIPAGSGVTGARNVAANSISENPANENLVGDSPVGESFSQTVLRLINKKGVTPDAVYEAANIDRKQFSKLKTNPQYQPSKETAIQLGVALQLNRMDFDDLLARAGFTLSPARKSDLIIGYFIDNNNYKTQEIDAALYKNNYPTLFSEP